MGSGRILPLRAPGCQITPSRRPRSPLNRQVICLISPSSDRGTKRKSHTPALSFLFQTTTSLMFQLARKVIGYPILTCGSEDGPPKERIAQGQTLPVFPYNVRGSNRFSFATESSHWIYRTRFIARSSIASRSIAPAPAPAVYDQNALALLSYGG